jgi:hypothetical protein
MHCCSRQLVIFRWAPVQNPQCVLILIHNKHPVALGHPLADGGHSVLYVCGVPGTGKTACIAEVLGGLRWVAQGSPGLARVACISTALGGLRWAAWMCVCGGE